MTILVDPTLYINQIESNPPLIFNIEPNPVIQEVNDFSLETYAGLISRMALVKDPATINRLKENIESDGFGYAKDFISEYKNSLQIPGGYSFKEVQEAFATAEVNNLEKRVAMMQMLQLAVENDITAMIDSIENIYIKTGYYPKSFSDMIVYNGCLRIVLDLCNKQQCIRMNELLLSTVSKSGKTKYKKMLHDFEGKKMYLEYYEQNNQ